MAQSIDFGASIHVADLAKGPRSYQFSAQKSDFSDLAERLGVHIIHGFSAEITATDKGAVHGVKLTGSITLDFEQICSVSMEPFKNNIKCALNLRLIGGDELKRLDEAEAFLNPEFDEYDALEGDQIDLTEIAIQTVSMEIDPYAHNMAIQEISLNNENVSINADPVKKPNPFAQLEELKNKT